MTHACITPVDGAGWRGYKLVGMRVWCCCRERGRKKREAINRKRLQAAA